MNAQDTPNGTRMMWNASVKAIWDRAQGTGLTAATATTSRRATPTGSPGSTDPASPEAHDPWMRSSHGGDSLIPRATGGDERAAAEGRHGTWPGGGRCLGRLPSRSSTRLLATRGLLRG